MKPTRSPVDINVDLSKRKFLQVGGVAAVGTLTLGAKGCGPSMNTWVQTIIGALEELKPLLPNQVQLISRAAGIAKSFNEAWQGGKFVDATAILENLAGVINQIIDDAGVGVSQTVKTAIAVIGISLRTIAVIMKGQAEDPQVAAAVSAKATTSASAARQKSFIERLADPNAVNALYATAKP